MDKVNCIVVGAGPAGSACAHSLSQKGIETVLIERGRSPGEKNVASSILSTNVLKYIIPNFRDDAPFERAVTEYAVLLLGEKDYISFQSRFYEHLNEPIAFTIFRSKFDHWFASKAEEAGATLITGMLVTDLLIDNGKIVGVRVGDDELLADVVVGADGVHSVVAQKAGLVVDDFSGYDLGIKEVIALPSDVIEERFQLKKGEGASKDGFGYPAEDFGGHYSLYTNNDSLSIAIFGPIEIIKDKGINLYDRLQMLKEHPYIKSLIRGSNTREYQAHILSTGGRVKPKNLYGNGVLLCGEAGGFLNPVSVGIPTGMLSGLMAAETIELAKKKGDYSARGLKNYLNFLDKTALIRMLHESRKFSGYRNMVTSGKRNLSAYRNHIVEALEGMVVSEGDFITKEPYPVLKHLYFKIGQDFVPRILRWPIRILIKVCSSFLHLLKILGLRRVR